MERMRSFGAGDDDDCATLMPRPLRFSKRPNELDLRSRISNKISYNHFFRRSALENPVPLPLATKRAREEDNSPVRCSRLPKREGGEWANPHMKKLRKTAHVSTSSLASPPHSQHLSTHNTTLDKHLSKLSISQKPKKSRAISCFSDSGASDSPISRRLLSSHSKEKHISFSNLFAKSNISSLKVGQLCPPHCQTPSYQANICSSRQCSKHQLMATVLRGK